MMIPIPFRFFASLSAFIVAILTLGSQPADAQTPAYDRSGPAPRETAPPVADPSEPAPPAIDYDSEPPYDLYERHWRRRARDYRDSRLRYRDRGWYRSPSHTRSYFYGPTDYDDRYYGLGGYSFDEGYDAGWTDGRRYAEWEQRDELGRKSYLDAMTGGSEAFQHGDYSAAVLHFVRAAKLDQGDPASRLHAAHAMVAVGRYKEALPALRRAFQLQPKLAYLRLDVRSEYGRAEDFETHLTALKRATDQAPDDPALWLLLGYYQFYSGREAEALVSLKRSDESAPGDFMTRALLEAAEMSAPSEPPAPQIRQGGPIGGPAATPEPKPAAAPGQGV